MKMTRPGASSLPAELQQRSRPSSGSSTQRPEVVVRESVEETTGTSRRATFKIQPIDEFFKVIKPRRELGEPTSVWSRSLQPPLNEAIVLHETDDVVNVADDTDEASVAQGSPEAVELLDSDDSVDTEAAEPRDLPGAVDPLGAPWADARRMRAHPISPDGNCQFRAVALAATGQQRDHVEFRQAAVDEVTGVNAEHYMPFMDQDKTAAAWREKMSMVGSDGDHLTLHALAQIVERPIVVWRRGYWQQPAEVCHVRGMTEWPTAAVIYLLLTEKCGAAQGFAKYHGHYEVLTIEAPVDLVQEEVITPEDPEHRARGRDGRRRRSKRVFVEDTVYT